MIVVRRSACLGLFLLLTMGMPKALLSDEVTVGFLNMPRELNAVFDDSPLAWFLRRAIADPAIYRSGAGIELNLVDKLEVSSQSDRLGMRLRLGVAFHNGAPLSSVDFEESGARCWRESGRGCQPEAKERVESDALGVKRTWIDLSCSHGQRQGDAQRLLELYSGCLIFEGRLARLFGEQFGRGTSMSSTGPYRVVALRAGREVQLQRNLAGVHDRDGAGLVVVRGFRDPGQGLTALRMGTIAALFVEDETLRDRVSSDETLVWSQCEGFPVIRRVSFDIGCEQGLSVPEMRYRS